MIVLKSPEEIELMRTAGKVNLEIFEGLKQFIRPGTTTMDIDRYVEEAVKSHGMIASEKGYCGFPANVCTSVNEEVVHGIPSKDRVLNEGDIVSVDLGTIYKGFYSDAARTYPVGKVSAEAQKLMDVAEGSFFEGLKFCKKGHRLGDVSHAIQMYVEANGFSIVRDYVGHGVGSQLHEPPEVPNYGKPGHGPRLAPGMTIAVEPMVNQGDWKVKVMRDGWTVRTADGSLAAHYENSLLITKGDPEILTQVGDLHV